MKKIILLALVCLSTAVSAQSDSTKSKISAYASYSVSLSNGNDFKTASFSSIEGGIMKENVGLGLIFCRGNLNGVGKEGDNITNYFYEAKISSSFPMGVLSGSVMFGYGGYINTKHNFIEYGGGICYTKGMLGYGVMASNWDGTMYVTPSITVNF